MTPEELKVFNDTPALKVFLSGCIKRDAWLSVPFFILRGCISIEGYIVINKNSNLHSCSGEQLHAIFPRSIVHDNGVYFANNYKHFEGLKVIRFSSEVSYNGQLHLWEDNNYVLTESFNDFCKRIINQARNAYTYGYNKLIPPEPEDVSIW